MREIQLRILFTLWQWWHSRLRDMFDLRWIHNKAERICIRLGSWCRLNKRGGALRWYTLAERVRYRYKEPDRPFYHLCCNGNSGGWRTSICDWLEIRWRNLEEEE
jgi:hypothetical protein